MPHAHGKAQDLKDFVFDLVRATKDVRVVLGKTAHAQQAVQDAGALVAVHGTQFSPAERQVAIAAFVRFVDHNVEWAVHRFGIVIRVVQFHR